MEEDLIKFETAKLAKEKGFDIPCKKSYWVNPDGQFWLASYSYDRDRYLGNSWKLAPTQSLLQKWLREEHSLHISLYIQENTYLHRWRVKVFYLDKLEDPNVHFWDFDTYEEALEKGLQGALNLI